MTEYLHRYRTEILPCLMKDFGYKNIHQVPILEKITLNMGVGKAVTESKSLLDDAMHHLELISGQKPIIRRAKKSIAGFKIREGWAIGCSVTLRHLRMYEFLQRFIEIAAPGIRDFRGFSVKSFDGRGNYSLGVVEQFIFPEIDYEKIDRTFGLDICITTRAKSDRDGYLLLKLLGFPFKDAIDIEVDNP